MGLFITGEKRYKALMHKYIVLFSMYLFATNDPYVPCPLFLIVVGRYLDLLVKHE